MPNLTPDMIKGARMYRKVLLGTLNGKLTAEDRKFLIDITI